eukprot:8726631-Heterocapsa_arctica.AAC.1
MACNCPFIFTQHTAGQVRRVTIPAAAARVVVTPGLMIDADAPPQPPVWSPAQLARAKQTKETYRRCLSDTNLSVKRVLTY